jgi:hypothetical protein
MSSIAESGIPTPPSSTSEFSFDVEAADDTAHGTKLASITITIRSKHGIASIEVSSDIVKKASSNIANDIASLVDRIKDLARKADTLESKTSADASSLFNSLHDQVGNKHSSIRSLNKIGTEFAHNVRMQALDSSALVIRIRSVGSNVRALARSIRTLNSRFGVPDSRTFLLNTCNSMLADSIRSLADNVRMLTAAAGDPAGEEYRIVRGLKELASSIEAIRLKDTEDLAKLFDDIDALDRHGDEIESSAASIDDVSDKLHHHSRLLKIESTREQDKMNKLKREAKIGLAKTASQERRSNKWDIMFVLNLLFLLSVLFYLFLAAEDQKRYFVLSF